METLTLVGGRHCPSLPLASKVLPGDLCPLQALPRWHLQEVFVREEQSYYHVIWTGPAVHWSCELRKPLFVSSQPQGFHIVTTTTKKAKFPLKYQLYNPYQILDTWNNLYPILCFPFNSGYFLIVKWILFFNVIVYKHTKYREMWKM